jgi:hypothetical protein
VKGKREMTRNDVDGQAGRSPCSGTTSWRSKVLNRPGVFLLPEGGDGLRKNDRVAGVIGVNTVISDKAVWIGRK